MKNTKIIITLIIALVSFSANATYKIMPPMDQSVKSWIMGGKPYYGNCAEGLTESTVEILNLSQNVYNYNSNGWCSLSNLDVSNQSLESLPNEFEALPNITTFNLRNNDFLDLNFLIGHNDFLNVYLENNYSLENINGLKNATTGNFYFDNYKKYDLLDQNSSFCQNAIDGNINIENNFIYNICDGINAETAWLDFINDCSNKDFQDIQSFKDSTQTISCSNQGIYSFPDLNEELNYAEGYLNFSSNKIEDLSPLSSFSDLYILNLSNNNITELSGLSNLISINSLYLNKNPLGSLSNLNNNFNISSTLNVSDTEIKDFSGLESVSSISSIYAENNDSLTSFKGLENVNSINNLRIRNSNKIEDVSPLSNIDIGTIYLNEEQLNQFKIKASATSLLCEDLKSNSAKTYVYKSSGSGNDYSTDFYFCEETIEEAEYNAAEWLSFFNASSTCRSIYGGTLESLNDLKTKSVRPYCYSMNLTDSDMPQGGLQNSNLDLYLYSNGLETLSGLKDVETVKNLRLNNNNISTLSNLSSLRSVNLLYLYDNPITSLSGLNNLETAGQIKLDRTNITNFNGLNSLTSVGTLKIYNTPSVTSFEGLENVGSIGDLFIRKSNNITDMSPLENVDIGKITLDESQLSQFTVKATAGSRLCNDLRSDATRIYVYNDSNDWVYMDGADLQFCEQTAAEAEYNAAEWLNFFNDPNSCGSIYRGPLEGFNDLKTKDARPYCNSKSLVDSDLPQGGLQNSNLDIYLYSNNIETLSGLKDIETVGKLRLYNNNISNLSNLSSLRNIDDLYLHNNPITSLSGLNNLETVGYLQLNGTNIANFNGLTSLVSVGTLRISDTPSVTSFSGLENVTSISNLYITGSNNVTDMSPLENVDIGRITINESQLSQFTTKAASGSKLCNDLRSDATRIYVYNDSNDWVYMDEADLQFCEQTAAEAEYNAAEWLNFFNDPNSCGSIYRGPLEGFNDLKTKDARPYCNSKSLVDSDLPQGGLQNSNLDIYLYSNNIETLSGLKDIETVGKLRLYNNNISNLSNLSSLRNIDDLYLHNNPITSLSGLNNLETVGYLQLNGTNIANFNGLTSLVSVGTLRISDTPSVTSFSGLENVTSISNLYITGSNNVTDMSPLENVDIGRITINESQLSQFTTKAASGSKLCNDLRSDATRIYVYNDSNDWVYMDGADLQFCEQTAAEAEYNAAEWLNFFNDPNSCGSIYRGPLEGFNDLKTKDARPYCNSKSLVDSDLPQGGLQNSNLDIYLYSNNIETLSGLKDIETVGKLRLYNNNISNLSNLSSLRNIDDLYLHNNPITSLSGLNNLETVGYLQLNGTNIANFNGLTSLVSVGTLRISDTPSVTSFSGLENVTSISNLYITGSNNVTDMSPLENVDIGRITINESQLSQFTTKAASGSKLCNDLRSDATRIYVYNDSNDWVYMDEADLQFCEQTAAEAEYNAAEWLNFFNDPNSCGSIYRGPLEGFNDLKTKDARPYCNSKSLVDSDLPQGGLQNSNLDIYLYSNNIETLSGLKDIETVGKLRLYNNNISNLSNLSSLRNIDDLYLQNNPLASLSGLSNLETVGQLQLDNTNISDFNGLTSLASVGTLRIYNTPSVTSFTGLENVTSIGNLYIRGSNNVTDMSPLENIDVGRITLNESQLSQFNVKASAGSRLCNDLRSNATRIYVYDNSNDWVYMDQLDDEFCN